jgi:hypothetical protein
MHMAAAWGVVPNCHLTLSDAGLPPALPGLSVVPPTRAAAAPRSRRSPAATGGASVSLTESLVLTDQSIDGIRSFCMANGFMPIPSSGPRAPSICVVDGDQCHVVIGFHGDLHQSTFVGATFADVAAALPL